MKPNFQALILFLISILFVGCKQDDQPTYDSEFGSILVTISEGGRQIPNANVLTMPQTDIYETDLSGAVILKDIEPTTYQVTAFHSDFGIGTGAAFVNNGQVTLVEIELSPGAVPNPIIDFISPLDGTIVDIDAETVFSISVADDVDNPQDISLEWTSDVDGLLSTAAASPSGNANITVSDLSEGAHTIQVRGTDSDGFIGGAVIQIEVQDIPNSVVLDPLQGLSTAIQLNWSVSDESSFSSYKVYRSETNQDNYQLIEEINDINTTTYVDNTVEIGTGYYYQIGLTLSNGQERLSNAQYLPFEGVSIAVGTQIEKMMVDPNRPFIYAVDRVNNALLFINTDLGALTKTIDVGSSPVDLDINLDGDKLYIANFGSTQINVVDLNTQEIGFSFFVDPDIGTWDGNPYRIAALSNNRLAFTSEDQWNSIKIVNAETGVNLSNGASIYRPNLFTNLAGTVLYAAESGSSGSQVYRYNVDSGNSLNEVDESSSGSAQRGSFITHDGQYIFFRKQKILANNLQSTLGTFPDNIYAANADGSIALGEDQYYNGENFAILGNLPVTSEVMASDPNEDIFYIYNAVSSSIVVFTP